jgi:hypothetical protein
LWREACRIYNKGFKATTMRAQEDKNLDPIKLEKQLTDFIFCGMGKN